MMDMMPMVLTRTADGAIMGKITKSTQGILAVLHGPEPRPQAARQPCVSLDAAVSWIEANSNLPDPGGCPHVRGVFGPVLHDIGSHRIFGCAHLDMELCAHDRDLVRMEQHPTLLALDDSGIIQAMLTKGSKGWDVQAKGQMYGSLSRANWPEAVALFYTVVVDTLFRGSGHERLHARSSLDAFLAKDTAFLHDQRRLKTLFCSARPAVPQRANIQNTVFYREPVMRVIGMLSRTQDVVEATFYPEQATPRHQDFATFSAAFDWIDAS